MKRMKKYKGYLIDLDGTMYRGREKIPEAAGFIEKLQVNSIPYIFVTNNSSQTQEQVASKLRSFGITCEPEQIVTSSMATASYISQQKKDASVYFIGEEGLENALKKEGLSFTSESPDFVVVGIDRSISYEKLSLACLAVRKGAAFIATNGDMAIPTERGLLPGNGAMSSVISVSTGITPTVIGKPEAIIMEQALRLIHMDKKDAIMVGDNYHTDILAGIHAGVDTLFVNTGVTRKEMLEQYGEKPTYVVNTLSEWNVE